MSDLTRAVQIAIQAHHGQVDKRGEPYIMHPIRVMLFVDRTDDRIVAALHDVVEDSDWTIEDLEAEGFKPNQLSAIDALTKRAGEAYFTYIERVRVNETAVRVKLSDLADNLDSTRLRHPLSETDRARLKRYEKAVEVLDGPSARAPASLDESTLRVVRQALEGQPDLLGRFQETLARFGKEEA